MENVPLYLRGQKLESVFQLLGSKEDNITFSVGWALAHAPAFRARFVQTIGAPEDAFEEVRMQRFGKDGGFTDIELLGPSAHAIVEAKRGWWLPSDLQFQRYAPRFEEECREIRCFVAMSDCSSTFAKIQLPPSIDGVPLHYLGWRDVEGLAQGGARHAEKRLLGELRSYLRTVATMQDPKSNLVYVVSLSGKQAREGSLDTYIDVVEKHGRYFHWVGHGYPKEPPNYIAFRYHGSLQSIHHIESFSVSLNVGRDVLGIEGPDDERELFVYVLGPAIRPPHEVKNGPKVVRNMRITAMLDLLLSCGTLTEARDLTKRRLAMSTDEEPGEMV